MTPPPDDGQGSVHVDSIRLLHVDDDAAFADMVASFLSREDDRFDTETATDADEALDRLAAGEFDCVVSDYDMPGRDGLAFLDAVRDDHPDLPFVLYTGKGSEDVASEAFSAGATDYLQKRSGTEQYAVLANKVTNYAEKYATERTMRRRARAMETANEGIAIVDREGRYTEINATYADLYGASPDDMVGEPWTITVPEAELDRLRRDAFPALDDDESWVGESLGRRTDGSTYPKLLSLAPLDDGGHVCVIRDITDRRTRERESRRYERMVNAMRESVCIYDVDGRFEVVNEYLADFYDTTRAELEGEASNLIPQIRDEAPDGTDPYQALLDGDRDELRGEMTSDFRDDGEVVLDYRLTPLPGDDTTGAVGVARDITDRKERERDLQRYERIVEASGDPVYMLDPDGRFLFVNDRLAEKMGYAREALLGEHVSILMETADVDEGERLIRSLLAGSDEQATFEMDAITANGERLVCESHVALVMVDGEFHGTVGTIRDITDRKAREGKLERQNERLEQFANIVSHDLQSPLNVAQGRLELARETCETDHLDNVASALDRCQRLVDDLLAITRQDVSSETFEPVSLAGLATDCWRNVPTPDATLDVTGDRTVRADRTRLRRLLENLVRNAVEHSSTGSRTQPDDAVEHSSTGSRTQPDDAVEHSSTGSRTQPDDAVEHSSTGSWTQSGDGATVSVGVLPDGFYVADDGPGIPESERERVFDPGYSTTSNGTGYGLSIVRTVADTHGWEVRVTDGDDGGARFEIRGVDG